MDDEPARKEHPGYYHRRNNNASIDTPGPNAIAIPSPVACDERRMRSIMNTNVADDILPKCRSTSRENRSASGGNASPF